MPDIPIERHRLDNGLRVILSHDDSAPIVAVNLWYDVGSKHEKPGRTGFAHLFEHMMFQGSEHVAKGEHFALVQQAGGTLNASTWLDRTNYFETLPSHELELGLWLESDRLASLLPAMTQEKLDNQREVVKNERRCSVDNQPYGTWDERIQAHLFPEGHTYHHPTIGSMEDLNAASLEDVGEFFATYYAPNNAVLTVAGDFDRDAALAMVERHFGPIPANDDLPPPPDMSIPPLIGQAPARGGGRSRAAAAHLPRLPDADLRERCLRRPVGRRRRAGRRSRLAPVQPPGPRAEAGPGRQRLPLPDRRRRVDVHAVGHRQAGGRRRSARDRAAGRDRPAGRRGADRRPSSSASATCTPPRWSPAWSASPSAPTGCRCTPACSTSRSASTPRSAATWRSTPTACGAPWPRRFRPDNRLVLTYLPAEAPAVEAA